MDAGPVLEVGFVGAWTNLDALALVAVSVEFAEITRSADIVPRIAPRTT